MASRCSLYPFFPITDRITLPNYRAKGLGLQEMDVVECRSDSEYAERPLALFWQGRRIEIAEIVATWRGPDEKGFRIKTVEGAAFDLAYHEIPDEWHIQPIQEAPW